jgi:death-on-curing protein
VDEPVWLTRPWVESLHADQVREHGGQLGLRDLGVLESALARPQHVWTSEADADLAMLAAEHGFGLARIALSLMATSALPSWRPTCF